MFCPGGRFGQRFATGTNDKSRHPRGPRLQCRALVAIYFLIWYTRSPASFFSDSILIPRFFPAVERNPRTLCACHSVAFMISARVAPLGRAISSRIFAPLLSARGALGSLSAADFAAFFAGLAGVSVAGLADFALFLALG